MVGYMTWTAKVDDLLALKRAAVSLQSALDRENDIVSVVNAIDSVERAVATIANGLAPANGGQTPEGRSPVLIDVLRTLSSHISSMKSRTATTGSRMSSGPLDGGLMSIAGIGIYGMVGIFLDSTDREDCRLS